MRLDLRFASSSSACARLGAWHRWVAGPFIALALGCGAPAETPDASAPDAGGPPCAACDDGLFCNGPERCGADGACVAGSPPCAAGVACDESADRCAEGCDLDADGDGARAASCGGSDCDDADPTAFPGNPEVCDAEGHDEDCDPTTFGDRDADRDGALDASCCNGDACGTDCDDARPGVHPSAPEVCNGDDDDCDDATDEGTLATLYTDADGDGAGSGAARMACADTPMTSPTPGDCDDANPFANPSTPEVCDGADNDCDGVVDDGALAIAWYVDADGDGFGAASSDVVVSCAPIAGRSPRGGDCDDTDRTVNPGAVERCDARDDDCDGLLDFMLSPGDGEDDDRDGVADARCPGGLGTDCNDRDPLVGPFAPEVCGNMTDDDCNGVVDDTSATSTWSLDVDHDGYGDAADPAPITSCEAQPGRSFRGGDCDDANADVHPNRLDGCDGIDADCDGTRDEDGVRFAFFTDADADGYGTGAPAFECVGPSGTATLPGDCADADPARHPGAVEDCNGRDDDCDGLTDEGVTRRTFYEDADRDGYGRAGGATRMGCVAPAGFAPNTTDCDDTRVDRHPGAPELCNTIDDDCDGAIDGAAASALCAVPNATGACVSGACGVGRCNAGFDDCDGLPTNGCETDLSTPANCGACFSTCSVASACTAGVCDDRISALLGVGYVRGDATLGGFSYAQTGLVCAVRPSGRAACWGQWGVRALASGVAHRPVDGTSGFTQLTDVAPIEGAIGTEGFTLGVVHGTGTVDCRQFGDAGECGAGAASAFYTWLRYPATDAAQIALGTDFACVRRLGGPVTCAGRNDQGQLGDGTTTSRATAAIVMGLGDAVDLDAGGYSEIQNAACAVRRSGEVACWGRGNPTPSPLGFSDAREIEMGRDTWCVARAGGVVSCLGGAAPTLTVPGGVAEMVSGESHFCARNAAGEVYCWGYNTWGQLGNASLVGTLSFTSTPARVLGLGRVVDLAATHRSTCALEDTGTVRCWGQSLLIADGRGAETPDANPTPIVVTGLP